MRLLLYQISLKDIQKQYENTNILISVKLGTLTLDTETQRNVKAQTTFESLLEAEISESIYNSGIDIEIAALTDNRKVIGKGKAMLKAAAPRIGEHAGFVVFLMHYDANGTGSLACRVNMGAFLRRETSAGADDGEEEEKSSSAAATSNRHGVPSINTSTQQPSQSSSKQKIIKLKEELNSNVGTSNVNVSAEKLKVLRECYDIARYRANELLQPHDRNLYLKVHGQRASKIYSALSTLTFVSMSTAKVDELEKYIMQSATLVPSNIFDLDEWRSIIKIARDCREGGSAASLQKQLDGMRAANTASLYLAAQPVQASAAEVRLLRGQVRDEIASAGKDLSRSMEMVMAIVGDIQSSLTPSAKQKAVERLKEYADPKVSQEELKAVQDALTAANMELTKQQQQNEQVSMKLTQLQQDLGSTKVQTESFQAQNEQLKAHIKVLDGTVAEAQSVKATVLQEKEQLSIKCRDTQEKLDKQTAQKQQVEQELHSLRDSLGGSAEELTQLHATLAASQAHHAEAQTALVTAQQETAAMQTKLDELEKALAAERESSAQRQTELDNLRAAAATTAATTATAAAAAPTATAPTALVDGRNDADDNAAQQIKDLLAKVAALEDAAAATDAKHQFELQEQQAASSEEMEALKALKADRDALRDAAAAEDAIKADATIAALQNQLQTESNAKVALMREVEDMKMKLEQAAAAAATKPIDDMNDEDFTAPARTSTEPTTAATPAPEPTASAPGSSEPKPSSSQSSVDDDPATLHACMGTQQGGTGWYTLQNELYYFCRDGDELILLCGPVSKDFYSAVRKDLAAAEAAEAAAATAINNSTTNANDVITSTASPRHDAKPPATLKLHRSGVYASRLQMEVLLKELHHREELLNQCKQELAAARIQAGAVVAAAAAAAASGGGDNASLGNASLDSHQSAILAANGLPMVTVDPEGDVSRLMAECREMLIALENEKRHRDIRDGAAAATKEKIDQLRLDAEVFREIFTKLTSRARGFLGRARVARLKTAQHARETGILFALDSTVQGETGWYMGPDKSVFYFVLQDDNWILAAGPISEDEYELLKMKWKHESLSPSQNLLTRCNIKMKPLDDKLLDRGELFVARNEKLYLSLPLESLLASLNEDGSIVTEDDSAIGGLPHHGAGPATSTGTPAASVPAASAAASAAAAAAAAVDAPSGDGGGDGGDDGSGDDGSTGTLLERAILPSPSIASELRAVEQLPVEMDGGAGEGGGGSVDSVGGDSVGEWHTANAWMNTRSGVIAALNTQIKADAAARCKAMEEAVAAAAEAERIAKEEAEAAAAAAEAERIAKEEAEAAAAAAEAERVAKEEAEAAVAAAEAERIAKEEAEAAAAAAEAERIAKEEAEAAMAAAEAERIAKEIAEAKVKAKEEAELLVVKSMAEKLIEDMFQSVVDKLVSELKAKEEAKGEADLKAKEEAELEAKEEAELKAKEESDRKAKEEADLKAKEEADSEAKEEEEKKVKEEAELLVVKSMAEKLIEEMFQSVIDKLISELKGKEEAKKEADLEANEDADLKAKEEADLKAKEEAELKAKEDVREPLMRSLSKNLVQESVKSALNATEMAILRQQKQQQGQQQQEHQEKDRIEDTNLVTVETAAVVDNEQVAEKEVVPSATESEIIITALSVELIGEIVNTVLESMLQKQAT